jgi:hypothetical protein
MQPLNRRLYPSDGFDKTKLLDPFDDFMAQLAFGTLDTKRLRQYRESVGRWNGNGGKHSVKNRVVNEGMSIAIFAKFLPAFAEVLFDFMGKIGTKLDPVRQPEFAHAQNKQANGVRGEQDRLGEAACRLLGIIVPAIGNFRPVANPHRHSELG